MQKLTFIVSRLQYEPGPVRTCLVGKRMLLWQETTDSSY